MMRNELVLVRHSDEPADDRVFTYARMNGLVSLIRLSVKISECTESDEVGIPAVTSRSSCGMRTRMQPHF